MPQLGRRDYFTANALDESLVVRFTHDPDRAEIILVVRASGFALQGIAEVHRLCFSGVRDYRRSNVAKTFAGVESVQPSGSLPPVIVYGIESGSRAFSAQLPGFGAIEFSYRSLAAEQRLLVTQNGAHLDQVSGEQVDMDNPFGD